MPVTVRKSASSGIVKSLCHDSVKVSRKAPVAVSVVVSRRVPVIVSRRVPGAVSVSQYQEECPSQLSVAILRKVPVSRRAPIAVLRRIPILVFVNIKSECRGIEKMPVTVWRRDPIELTISTRGWKGETKRRVNEGYTLQFHK